MGGLTAVALAVALVAIAVASYEEAAWRWYQSAGCSVAGPAR